MSVTYYGVGGKKYETIEHAWEEYFEELYGDFDHMPAEEYHDKFLIFVSGILSGMNIVSTRYHILHDEQGVPDGTAIKRAIMTLVNESLERAAHEYKLTARANKRTRRGSRGKRK